MAKLVQTAYVVSYEEKSGAPVSVWKDNFNPSNFLKDCNSTLVSLLSHKLPEGTKIFLFYTHGMLNTTSGCIYIR